MAVSPLMPAAGIAAAALARGAVSAVESGLSFAQELLRPAPDTKPVPTEKPPTKQEFAAALQKFVARLQAILNAAGASSSQPLELVSDGLGGVQVAADHPHRSLIEQTIGGDSALLAEFDELAKQFRELAPTTEERDRRDFGLVVAGDEIEPFLR
jgi:hypothetical protein